RLIDIVVFLAENCQKDKEYLDKREIIINKLREIGYTHSEAVGALEWFYNFTSKCKNRFGYSDLLKERPIRILSTMERQYFTKDGYGYLYKLNQLGLINEEQFEIIVTRGMMVQETIIDKEVIKALASLFLFDVDWPRDKEIAAFWLGWRDTETIH
ncbi:DUF494 family protein, partial [bacterium]|nr:DUF494 family protein [bacterium]